MTTKGSAGLLAARPLLIGVVHLPPLPGAPGWECGATLGETIARAREDAAALAEAGFRAVLVENFGDAPFFKDAVPPETVAAMAVVAREVRACVGDGVHVGVNVLRNDALSALAVATAAELAFVRVNVLSGAVLADQGVIEGRAAEVLRARARLAPDVRILADVRVKHAAPLAERALEEEARDLVARGGADALIASGSRTGEAVDLETLERVRRAVPDAVLLVGSGARASTVGRLLTLADGVIVGTALKVGERTTAPVDPERAARFVEAAGVRGR